MLRACGVALFLAVAVVTPAAAQLLPPGFFEQVPPSNGKAQVEADYLAYDQKTSTISAEGGVIMHYAGYTLTADRITYNQATGDVYAEGNAAIRDPGGTIYTGERVTVTDRMKAAFIESLTLTTPDGALITADSVDYARELESILSNATYSPCGLCIDSKGRKIGWRVKASKIVYNGKNASVYLENSTLELLGIPMAWIPWLVVPDPSQPRAQGFRLPGINYAATTGLRADLPYFVPITEDIDLLLTPTLMTRQGALMQAELTHRLGWGTYDVKASGVYQLDPMAFAVPEAQVRWRGAIQTTGRFVPLEDWTAGWSYTAFSDAAYLVDYALAGNKNVINEVYATYLTRDTYFDIRARRHNYLGNTASINQAVQAAQVPRLEAQQYVDLEDYGQLRFSANVSGIIRAADAVGTFNGINYVFGYQENKIHGTFEGSWQNQYILPGGLVATPYAGLRVDAGYYDGSSPLLPGAVSMLSATPIAAMDVRWPLVAVNSYDSHLFEPVAQLVYRGSSMTLTGITNDDAQSFVFDDTLLFSYNRFSGQDRQETGLRANVGGRYVANFADGTWLQLLAGQSYFLGGTNALGVIDTAQTGNSTGLGNAASYIVLGVTGSPGYGLDLGAKAQIDPATFRVMRATAASNISWGPYGAGLAYTYLPANPAVGTVVDQHEATLSASGPLPIDYWRADASVSWDLAANQWLEATAGVTYDDGYLVLGAFGAIRGATHESPNSYGFGFKFRLKGPDGGDWGL